MTQPGQPTPPTPSLKLEVPGAPSVGATPVGLNSKSPPPHLRGLERPHQ